MIIRKADHFTTAVEAHQYPPPDRWEVAFAGRSNVGKSSLVNALLNRRSLAYVGNTPGKTRVINFYHVNDDLALVDLAGYGYAKVSKEEKKSWGRMIETYLSTRESLVMVLLLVDLRHPPTEDDCLMAQWLRDTGRPFAVVATKADKITRQDQRKHVQQIRETLALNEDEPLVAISSEKKTGIPELWALIGKVLDTHREVEG